jgi:hypothetical protein
MGSTLTVVAGGETFTYSRITCAGMEATYDLVAGDVAPFNMGDEILVIYGDGYAGTYVAGTSKNMAILETCIIPETITCTQNLRIQTTGNDVLTLQDIFGVDCDAMGSTLTVVAGGETFTYSRTTCAGMEATYDLDAGDVAPFNMGDEILVIYGDGYVGTYIAGTSKNMATLETCIIPETITCTQNLRIETTGDDVLTLQDIFGVDCDALGAVLTLVANGETFSYSRISCGGMEATYSLDAGDVFPFNLDDEIIVTFGDEFEGTYIAVGKNSAVLETCRDPRSIPTLSQWGIILLFLLGSIFGILVLNSRRKQILPFN